MQSSQNWFLNADKPFMWLCEMAHMNYSKGIKQAMCNTYSKVYRHR